MSDNKKTRREEVQDVISKYASRRKPPTITDVLSGAVGISFGIAVILMASSAIFPVMENLVREILFEWSPWSILLLAIICFPLSCKLMTGRWYFKGTEENANN